MFSNPASVQPLGKTNSSGKLQPENCTHLKKLMIGSLGASLGGRFLSGKVTCILLSLNKPCLTMVLLWLPIATLFLCLCLNLLYGHSPCSRGGSSPQLANGRQRLKFGLEEGLLMKTRITNQSPLLALVIRVRTAQHRCCGKGRA